MCVFVACGAFVLVALLFVLCLCLFLFVLLCGFYVACVVFVCCWFVSELALFLWYSSYCLFWGLFVFDVWLLNVLLNLCARFVVCLFVLLFLDDVVVVRCLFDVRRFSVLFLCVMVVLFVVCLCVPLLLFLFLFVL